MAAVCPDPVTFLHIAARHPCLFRAVPRTRVTFLSGKVTKATRAGRDGLADIVSARLSLLLASHAPARTRTSVCSNRRALLARSASSLRHRDSAGKLTSAGHPWPAFPYQCLLGFMLDAGCAIGCASASPFSTCNASESA